MRPSKRRRLAWAIAAVVAVAAAIAVAGRLPVKPNRPLATPSTNSTQLAPSNAWAVAALSHTGQTPVRKAPVGPTTIRPPHRRPLRARNVTLRGHHPGPRRLAVQ